MVQLVVQGNMELKVNAFKVVMVVASPTVKLTLLQIEGERTTEVQSGTIEIVNAFVVALDQLFFPVMIRDTVPRLAVA